MGDARWCLCLLKLSGFLIPGYLGLYGSVTVSDRPDLATSEGNSEMLLGFEKVKAVCG